MPKDVDESLIEATIRRVAQAKAARASGDEPDIDDMAPGPQAEADDPDETAAGDPARAGADEGLIEATIRRVQAAKAAQAGHQTLAEAMQTEAHEEHPAGPVPSRWEKQPPAPLAPEASPRLEAARVVADGGEWREAARRIDEMLADTKAAISHLSARIDSLASRIEEIASATSTAHLTPTPPGNGYRGHLAPVEGNEDEWDEAPVAQAKMVVGLPPRPAIFRDSSPLAAVDPPEVEASLEMPASETRSLPKPQPPLKPAPKRGLDLLPQTYRITVEDKRRGVDLVPLHRALLSMQGVRDMSLLSYANGIAIVSLETAQGLDQEELKRAVSRAMAREARVEQHNENTIVVKLAEE